MKKLLAAAIMFACLLGCAFAEERQVYFDETYVSDLDSDGMNESWSCSKNMDDNGDTVSRLTVASEDGSQATFDADTWIDTDTSFYVEDLDGDGVAELLASANTSENYGYTTWCLRYEHGRISEVLFGEAHSEAYYLCFNGRLAGIKDGRLVLTAYTDVLGTWNGEWIYSMDANGRLAPENDGWCKRVFEDSMELAWEYGALTLEVETAYRCGDEVGMLYPGEKILITGSDHFNRASFVTEDGREGELYIMHKAAWNIGWMVNLDTYEDLSDSGGYTLNLIDEEDYFKYVPYRG